MAGHECHHCKQWIEAGEDQDCWTTTEAALTEELSDELRDAWERIRETALTFGDHRRSFLQVCVFLGRAVRRPQVRRVERKSAAKLVNIVHITHRDEVEPPFTDWLREAYDLPDQLAPRKATRSKRTARR